MRQEAAVLVALVDLGGEAGLLFNKRSTNLSSHRGQVGNHVFFSSKLATILFFRSASPEEKWTMETHQLLTLLLGKLRKK